MPCGTPRSPERSGTAIRLERAVRQIEGPVKYLYCGTRTTLDSMVLCSSCVDNAAPWGQAACYQGFCNHERIHESLDNLTPADVYL
jgi:hypothetical protein